MARTLQERYEEKRLNELRDRVKNDTDVLRDHRFELMMEAMDPNDLKQAEKIIEKLRALKGQGLDDLDNAIEKAESELNKFTAKPGLLQKLGFKKNSPITKIMAFVSGLETAFKQLPSIIKNNVKDLKDLEDMKDQSLSSILNDEEKLKTLKANVERAFRPQGVWGSFGTVPYINIQNFVRDIIDAPVKTLTQITGVLKEIPPPPQPKSNDAEKTGTTPPENAEPTSTTEPATQAPPEPRAGKTVKTSAVEKKIAQLMKTEFKTSTVNVQKMIDAMKKMGVTFPED